MKIKSGQLEKLLELQGLLLANRKLELEASQKKQSLQNDELREQMLALSSELNQKRTGHEELERDRRRVHDELELVNKRLSQDQARLKTTAVARDAMGLQHEIETLEKRKGVLTEQLQGIDLELGESSREQHELQLRKDKLEIEADEVRERTKLELDQLRVEHAANLAAANTHRSNLEPDLIEFFDRRFARGIAVGRLKSTSCGACNMNLNSSAMTALSHVPSDEAAYCPECQAILIR